MAHFYGGIHGARGEATRTGTKSSGYSAYAASWSGKVVVRLFEDHGVDMAVVSLEPHHGAGVSRLLYRGPVSGAPELETATA